MDHDAGLQLEWGSSLREVMMMATYIVPIIFKGQDNFIVEAGSLREAEDKARSRFNDGDSPDKCGNEWQEIDRIGTIETIPARD